MSRISTSITWKKLFSPLKYRKEQQKAVRLYQVHMEATKYFADLPKCTGKVLVASPIYEDIFFKRLNPSCDDFEYIGLRAEIFVNTKDFAEFLLLRKNAGYQNDEMSIWIGSFIDWLNDADPLDLSTTFVPEMLRPIVLEHDVERIVKKCPLELYCLECFQIHSSLNIDGRAKGLHPGWNLWTESWFCGSGHLVFKHPQEMHVICSRPKH